MLWNQLDAKAEREQETQGVVAQAGRGRKLVLVPEERRRYSPTRH